MSPRARGGPSEPEELASLPCGADVDAHGDVHECGLNEGHDSPHGCRCGYVWDHDEIGRRRDWRAPHLLARFEGERLRARVEKAVQTGFSTTTTNP